MGLGPLFAGLQIDLVSQSAFLCLDAGHETLGLEVLVQGEFTRLGSLVPTEQVVDLSRIFAHEGELDLLVQGVRTPIT